MAWRDGTPPSSPVRLEQLEARLLLSTGLWEVPEGSLPGLDPKGLVDAAGTEAGIAELPGRLIGPAPAPAALPEDLGRPPSSGAVYVPHYNLTDYDWWYGCSPTAGGLHAAWWDQEVKLWGDAADTTFPGDPTHWLFGIYPSSDPDDFLVPDYANGVVNGWNHANDGDTWQGHPPDSIGDFMLTSNGGSYTDNIEWGMVNFMAWDDLRTPENESWSVTTSHSWAPSWDFEDYKAEIDAGRPVHLWLTSPQAGHSVLGVGYYDPDGPGGEEWIELYTTWHWGLSEWQWTDETYSGYGFTCDGAMLMDVLPQSTGLTGYFALEHGAARDLTVNIGLGDPSSPVWSTNVWAGGGGTKNNLVLTDIDLSAAEPYLSTTQEWYLEVYDGVGFNEGSIMDFQIRSGDQRWFTTDNGEPISDYETHYAFIADGVDLRGEGFSADPVHLAGAGTTDVTFQVANVGTQDAGAFEVAFFFSEDEIFDNGDEVPADLHPSDPNYDPANPNVYRISGGLLAGASVGETITLSVPSTDPFGPTGTHYLGMRVDVLDEVSEYQEANNHGQGPGLDLVGVDWREAIYFASMNSAPSGWTMEGDWAWGAPTGGGSHSGDPSSGYSGQNVVGYNLNGDYTDELPVRYATTAAIDCTGYEGVTLSFYRWLGVESSQYDHASIEVSNDGSAWTTVWEHTAGAFSESQWSYQEYDISAVADDQSTVYVRWGMGPTDYSVTYPGWNIDDVLISGQRTSPPKEIRGSKWYDIDRDQVWDGDEPGMPGWVVFLDENGNGTLEGGTYALASSDGPKAIHDRTTIVSLIEASGLTETVADVNVTVNITHAHDEDLDVHLLSPSGTVIELFTDVGGSGNDFAGTTLDDEATWPITSGSAPFVGSYQPEGPLSDLDGEDPNGTWTLYVYDDEWGNEGTLLDWSIAITTGEPSTTTDANGDYVFTDLAGGAYTVAEVCPAGWVQTYPGGDGTHDVWVDGLVKDADFGNYAVPGDANLDGIADGGDYTIWADHYMLSGGWADGDFDFDGVVNGADYVLWADHYGTELAVPAGQAAPGGGLGVYPARSAGVGIDPTGQALGLLAGVPEVLSAAVVEPTAAATITAGVSPDNPAGRTFRPVRSAARGADRPGQDVDLLEAPELTVPLEAL